METIKMFDVITYRQKYPIFNDWLDNNEENYNNDTGKLYFVNSTEDYDWDYKNIYQKLDNLLMSEWGCKKGEKVMFYISW